jgi:hypothetical protein
MAPKVTALVCLVCLIVTAYAQQSGHTREKDPAKLLQTLLLALNPVAAATPATQSKAEQMQSRRWNAFMGAVDELVDLPESAPDCFRPQPQWQQQEKQHGPGEYFEVQRIGAKPARVQQQQPSKAIGTDDLVPYWNAPALVARAARMQQQPGWKPRARSVAADANGTVDAWEVPALTTRAARIRLLLD